MIRQTKLQIAFSIGMFVIFGAIAVDSSQLAWNQNTPKPVAAKPAAQVETPTDVLGWAYACPPISRTMLGNLIDVAADRPTADNRTWLHRMAECLRLADIWENEQVRARMASRS